MTSFLPNTPLFRSIIGAIGGYFGVWFDAVLSRLTDIFFAIPLVLGAIVIMQLFQQQAGVPLLVLVLVIFGWTSIARIARSSVMSEIGRASCRERGYVPGGGRAAGSDRMRRE